MKLKRCMLVAGVAALAVSSMATPAFAAKPPMAERIAAADSAKAKKDGNGAPRPWAGVVSAILIGGLIALAGAKPPKNEDGGTVRSGFLL